MTGVARSFSDMTLREFIDVVASSEPAPGGGSASAVAGAIGAALVAMVAGLTPDSSLTPDTAEKMHHVRSRGRELAAALLEAADADTAAFNAVMAAYRMPKSTDEEKAARRAAIQAAMRGAVDAPRSTCVLAREGLELAAFAAEHGNPNAASDAGVGAMLLDAAMGGAGLNIRINLGSIKDPEFADEMRTFANEVEQSRTAVCSAAMAAACAKIEGQ